MDRNINKATYKFTYRLVRLRRTNSGVWFASDFVDVYLADKLFEMRYVRTDSLAYKAKYQLTN